jgi:SAM-dependent methyltransferase
MGFGKFLLIPQLMYYGIRAPRDQNKAWDRFWGTVKRTGAGGEVLWDAASKEELDRVLSSILARADKALPMVDVGCGNGRFSRLFAASFPKVLAVDVAPNAIQKAKEESRGVENVTYRVEDISVPGTGARIAAELGEVNVYMRGVFHVLDREQRKNAAQNLREMLGKRGVVYFSETNYEGDPLDQLVAQGATPTSMPLPLKRCIESGIKPPRHFGDAQLREIFPQDRWEILESGSITMHGVPLTTKGEVEPIPGFYGIVRARG